MIPAFLGQLGLVVFEVVDIFFVGKISVAAVSGMSAATFILWTLHSLMMSTCTGSSSLISQAFGAKNQKRAWGIGRDSFLLSLIFSFALQLLYFWKGQLIFHWMGLPEDALSAALEYFDVIMLGLPIGYIYFYQGYVFNAYGDNKASNNILLFSLVINIVFDPILIWGIEGVIPALGVKGAAWSSLLGQSIGVIWRAYVLQKKDYWHWSKEIPLFHYTRSIFKIGMPAALTNVTWSIVFPMLSVFIIRFGNEALAALNIGQRYEGIPYFLGISMSIAVSALVGRFYGAGDIEKIKMVVLNALWTLSLLFLPVLLLFGFWAEGLISLLNGDPLVVFHGAKYLKIIAVFEMFMAYEIVLEGAFNGLGKTKRYMFVRIPLTFLRIPLAYYLAFERGYGIVGIWWAISITTLLKGGLLLIIWRQTKISRENNHPSFLDATVS